MGKVRKYPVFNWVFCCFEERERDRREKRGKEEKEVKRSNWRRGNQKKRGGKG